MASLALFIYARSIAVMVEWVTKLRKLYLLRHAKSSWDDPDMEDLDRPLNKRGRLAARLMADYIARSRLHPALVLVSTAVRTRETWDIIEPKLEGTSAAIEDSLYEASKGDLLHRLRKVDDHIGSVMLIGHNPGIGRLAESLVGHNGEPEVLEHMFGKFSTGALAVIELNIAHWGELEAGTGNLVTYTRPKDLEEIE